MGLLKITERNIHGRDQDHKEHSIKTAGNERDEHMVSSFEEISGSLSEQNLIFQIQNANFEKDYGDSGDNIYAISSQTVGQNDFDVEMKLILNHDTCTNRIGEELENQKESLQEEHS